MLYLSNQNQFVEKAIVDNLRSTGVIRMKGEEQLFKQYMYFIRVGAKKYALAEDSLFDAYSDTVLAGIEAITGGAFQGRSSLKTFLFQIFHNKCVDLLRKKTALKNCVYKTVDISDRQMHICDASLSVVDKLIQRADSEQFKQQLNKLCDKSRRLLLLSAEGYSDKEIAVQMNFKTRDVVKTSRLRCIRTLRQLNKAS